MLEMYGGPPTTQFLDETSLEDFVMNVRSSSAKV